MGKKTYPKPPQDELDAWVARIEDEKGHKICGAWRPRAGKPCEQHEKFLKPNGRCRIHGGNSVEPGPGHHSYKHGHYSKIWPEGIAERASEMLQNPDLGSVRHLLALADVRLSDILHDMSAGGGGAPSWKELQAHIEKAEKAAEDGRPDDQRLHLNALIRDVRRGVEMQERWEAVNDQMEHYRKLAETESRITSREENTISVDAAVALVGATADIIKRHVKDQHVLQAVSHDIASLLGSKQRPEA